MSPARALPALLALVALVLAACGGGGGGGGTTTRQTAGQQSKPVVASTSNVPRYGGKPDATKQPTAGSLAEFRHLPLADPNAAVPNVKGSNAPLEQFLDTVGNDAATYWQQVFNNSGFKLEGNKQTVVTDSAQGACGAVSSTDASSYCSADSTVYLTTAWFRDKVVPIGDAAAVTLVGILYGFRVEDVLGLYDAQKPARSRRST